MIKDISPLFSSIIIWHRLNLDHIRKQGWGLRCQTWVCFDEDILEDIDKAGLIIHAKLARFLTSLRIQDRAEFCKGAKLHRGGDTAQKNVSREGGHRIIYFLKRGRIQGDVKSVSKVLPKRGSKKARGMFQGSFKVVSNKAPFVFPQCFRIVSTVF